MADVDIRLYEPMQEEKVIEIEIERLRDFHDHPFKIREDRQMKSLMESVEKYGILTPLIVRPVPEGVYEIISGHRRRFVAKMLGYRKVPVIIRVMKDDEAVIAMIDANNQREEISISEKAFAYKMKYDAMKRRSGKQKKDNQGSGGPVDYKGKRTVQILGEQGGDSPKQVQRYLRIPELLPELIEKLDNGGISFNPAVEISFLPEDEQKILLDLMDYSQVKPSLSQAQRIKKLSQEGKLWKDDIRRILNEDKKRYSDRIVLEHDKLMDYFPEYYTMDMIREEVFKMLEARAARLGKKK